MAAIRGETPRAVIHKRILDAAAERPDASMAELADAVGGASVDLVERVLEEYGDPGEPAGTEGEDAASSRGTDEDGTEGVTEPAESRTAGGQPVDGASPPPVPDGLTDEQRAALEAVYAHPDASQRELGERLGVSASTVHNRLAGVDGFEWDDRWRFVRGLFDGATDGGATAADHEAVAELAERVESLESRVEELAGREAAGDAADPPLPPELAHKVAHACMASDKLDGSEELAVLRALMGSER